MELTVVWTWVCLGLVVGVGGAGRGALLLAKPALFAVESTVLVNDVARKDRELGYKIKASLEVHPLYHHQQALLLHFQLKVPKLYLRGKHPNAEFVERPSIWDGHSSSSFYAHWDQGIITTAYLDPQEPVDILNYKKSIISLFQFNFIDGEFNETDVSGECSVLYETISDDIFRKIKKRCSADAPLASVRRVARYSLDGGSRGEALAALHAEELLEVGGALGLKARAWHSLTARTGATKSTPPLDLLDAALAALPPKVAPAALPLAPPASTEPSFADDQEWEAELQAQRARLLREESEAGAGGEAETAQAALRLATALRRAPAAALRALVLSERVAGVEGGVCRALGLAGTLSALAALDELVQLRARDALLPLATVYLEAFALSDRPEASAVAEVLRVGEEAAKAEVRESALLAGAAAAATRAALGDAAAAPSAKEALLRALARCRDESCTAARLRALANLRQADTVETLLEHARRWERAPVASLAALDALDALPPGAFGPAHLRRVLAVALQAAAPLEVRAAALQLALQGGAHSSTVLAQMSRALLEENAPHELRRVFWQRLRVLTATRSGVNATLDRLHPFLRSWDAQALNGMSSVLRRETGWGAGGWRAALDSAQLTQGGLLRHGRTRLLAHADDSGVDTDLLTVEVWARGMEALAGDDAAPASASASAVAPAAGLAFVVNGVRTRGFTLFDGQAELLGHVWAGTGSAPTPVLRAVVPLAVRAHWQPLAAGVHVLVGWRAAGALAADAHAQVSLWWRTARSALSMRAALAGHAQLRLATAWGEVRADARSALEPRLHIATDVDFYETVALCVRAHTDECAATRNVSLVSEQGGRALRVSRSRLERLQSAGRTLALGAPNDITCRTLRAADPPQGD